jgi:hypothetical protein
MTLRECRTVITSATNLPLNCYLERPLRSLNLIVCPFSPVSQARCSQAPLPVLDPPALQGHRLIVIFFLITKVCSFHPPPSLPVYSFRPASSVNLSFAPTNTTVTFNSAYSFYSSHAHSCPFKVDPTCARSSPNFHSVCPVSNLSRFDLLHSPLSTVLSLPAFHFSYFRLI